MLVHNEIGLRKGLKRGVHGFLLGMALRLLKQICVLFTILKLLRQP